MDRSAVEAAHSRASVRRRVSQRASLGHLMHLEACGVLGVHGFRSSIQSINIWYAFHPAAAVNSTTILTFVPVMQDLELCDCQVPS